MKRLVLTLAILLVTTLAHAQIYQWKDDKGMTIMSDKPPTGKGRQVSKQEIQPASQETAVPQKTAAERELDFRKRQQEAAAKATKNQAAQAEAAENKQNCERSKMQLQTLEAGDRVQLRDENGERYFMEDAQREQEIVKTRKMMQNFCK